LKIKKIKKKKKVFQRIDYIKKEKFIKEKSMEFFWIPNNGVKKKEKMLTHIMSENYCVI
jgi:hypothetical protein